MPAARAVPLSDSPTMPGARKSPARSTLVCPWATLCRFHCHGISLGRRIIVVTTICAHVSSRRKRTLKQKAQRVAWHTASIKRQARRTQPRARTLHQHLPPCYVPTLCRNRAPEVSQQTACHDVCSRMPRLVGLQELGAPVVHDHERLRVLRLDGADGGANVSGCDCAPCHRCCTCIGRRYRGPPLRTRCRVN